MTDPVQAENIKKAIMLHHIANVISFLGLSYIAYIYAYNIEAINDVKMHVQISIIAIFACRIILGIKARSLSKTTHNPISVNHKARPFYFGGIVTYIIGLVTLDSSPFAIYLILFGLLSDLAAILISMFTVTPSPYDDDNLLDDQEIE